jgi:uncharacterized protein (TIGR02147 family)
MKIENNEDKNLTKKNAERPDIFSYSDYRIYLADSLVYIQSKNAKYSATAFVRQAGFGENSRGYFSLILSGKRNLSHSTILGFAKTLKMSERENYQFENLVLFNQAETSVEKNIYFERISKNIKGKKNCTFELMKSHYNYLSNWYLVAIRELVSLRNFKEDPDWIAKKLRGRVSKKDIKDAITDLINIGLLKRQDNQKLIQTDNYINFTDTGINYQTVTNIHQQLLDIAKISLIEDDYENRSASCIILATEQENFPKIREEIRIFREHMMNKYGHKEMKNDCVVSLSMQLNHLTEIPKTQETI